MKVTVVAVVDGKTTELFDYGQAAGGAVLRRRIDSNDIRGVQKLISYLTSGRTPNRIQLRWPRCGVVPSWQVIEAPARMWLVRTPDGAERTLNDAELTELLRTTWVAPAAAAIAREQARRLCVRTAA